ncbi:MAG: tripartite tricarboxylate transporter substrate binding protein [Burkholderiales bacterium]|nr:tripartite tricarboxylate transporter substrate binding protein [Burkholderiales bacterium]
MLLMNLSRLLVALAVCSVAAAWAQPVRNYPSRTVRVVIPWPAGGLTDVAGRIVFQKMSETMGQQFVIDNRGGASGTIGADLVAKSAPDGYTLMVHSTTHVGNPHVYGKLPYDTLKDFVGVGLLVAQTGLLVVHPSLPVKSVRELVALAKARPDQLLYASSGSGSFSHLAIALLTSMTGTKMVHVPYKGGGPSTTALVSGETQLLVGSPAAVLTQIKANRLRLLAVTSDTRLPQFPEVPTVAEAGVPGYEFRGWVGVLAPAGTPKAIIDRLNAEIKNAMDSPDTVKRLESFEPWTMTPEQTAARIRSDYDKYGQLIKLTGVRNE